VAGHREIGLVLLEAMDTGILIVCLSISTSLKVLG
jgi:hypothetical protein